MKRLVSWTLAAVMALALCACGGEAKPFDPVETAAALLEAPGVFSEELERLDNFTAIPLYELSDYEWVEIESYHSTGATAEEVTVLRFLSEEKARDFEAKAQSYLADQREANESYRPQEMPKLEKAVTERRGETFLILVCADYEAAQTALKGLN